jgi:type 1 glutamine amidotransferase
MGSETDGRGHLSEAGSGVRPMNRFALPGLVVCLSALAQLAPDSSTERRSRQPPKLALALADVSTSTYQHESLSHALSILEQIGLDAGLYDTLIRTDSQLVTKGAVALATGTLTFYRNLNDFDAVILLTAGDPKLTDSQKADLLSFVREGGGLIAFHSTLGSFRDWPEFVELTGGRTAEDPQGIADVWVTVADPAFPGMNLLHHTFQVRDVLSQVEPHGSIHVLAKTTGGIPVMWSKTYGKGRVFVSQLGHESAIWDRPDLRRAYLEAIRFVIRNPR